MELIPKNFYFDELFDLNKQNNMKCDIYEKDKNYYIEMEMPGLTKEDINIEVKNEYLKVTAFKEHENTNREYLCKERYYGKIERNFYLGNIDENNISAEFKNGILTILVPKLENSEMKKLIQIK